MCGFSSLESRVHNICNKGSNKKCVLFHFLLLAYTFCLLILGILHTTRRSIHPSHLYHHGATSVFAVLLSKTPSISFSDTNEGNLWAAFNIEYQLCFCSYSHVTDYIWDVIFVMLFLCYFASLFFCFFVYLFLCFFVPCNIIFEMLSAKLRSVCRQFSVVADSSSFYQIVTFRLRLHCLFSNSAFLHCVFFHFNFSPLFF